MCPDDDVRVERISRPPTTLDKHLVSIHQWQGRNGLNPRELLRSLDRLITLRLWEGETGQDGRPMTLQRAVEEPWPIGVGMGKRQLDRVYKLAEDAGVDPALIQRVQAGIDSESLQARGAHGQGGRRKKARPPKIRGNNVTSNHRGNRASYTRSRLARDRPDLHQQVTVGKLTPNAAARQAGFRKPTATVPIDSVDSAVRALLRRFPSTDIRAALDRAED
jgi:hypothetical protein